MPLQQLEDPRPNPRSLLYRAQRGPIRREDQLCQDLMVCFSSSVLDTKFLRRKPRVHFPEAAYHVICRGWDVLLWFDRSSDYFIK